MICKDRSRKDAVSGGCSGCAVGIGGGVAWGMRTYASAFRAERHQEPEAVRDALWLE